MGKRVTTETFILGALDKHDGRYSYYKTEYFKSSVKVCITCDKHGDFLQTPNDHLKGSGCKKCWRDSRLGVSYYSGGGGGTGSGALKKPQSYFLEKAFKAHKDKYTYTRASYEGSTAKVVITCKDHGDFLQAPAEHYKGKGCPSCAGVKRLTTDTFITKASSAHNDRYTYPRTKYTNNKTSIVITCDVHGDFRQSPANHTQGAGCPSCAVTGFDHSKPAVLYYFKVGDSKNNVAYKIGVTNNNVSKRYSKEELSRIDIIFEEVFSSGADAYFWEQEVLKHYKHLKYEGPALLHVGNTELFTIDIFNTLEES